MRGLDRDGRLGVLRAQFWSFDVIFSVVIFSVALTILSLAWFNISNQLSLSSGNTDYIMQLQAEQLSQNLLGTGSPVNWETDLQPNHPSSWVGIAFGLSAAPGSANLSTAKIYSLIGMAGTNYTDSQQALGVGYNYYIDITGGPYNITIGENPLTSGAVTVFVSKRSAFLNKVPVTLDVYIWSNQKANLG